MDDATASRAMPERTDGFADQHPWDRNFFLLYAVLVWLGIIMGFGGEIVDRIQHHAPPYPLIVHLHAIAFVGWLVLFTTQIVLIRRQAHDHHRKLGLAMIGLAAVMVVLGPATAIYMQRVHFGTTDGDPAFMSVQFTDIAAFAIFVTAAILLRKTSSAHKRLILLATLYISDAGYARWLGGPIGHLFGHSPIGMFCALYLPSDLLIIGLGIYDVITRRRLHPVYVAGLAVVLALQASAVALYGWPAWTQAASRLIGH